MLFVTNKISTGDAKKTMKDIVEEITNKKRTKTASADEGVKVAEQSEEVSSGQLDVEPLHQEGESTNQDAGKPKEKASSSETSQKEEVSSGQPEAEGKLVNDPKVEKEAETEEETKEAQSKLDAIMDKVRNGEELTDDEKTLLATAIDASKSNDEDEDKDEDKDEETKEADTKEQKQEKVAFVKIANLDEKTKSWLRDYWSQLYPPEYVDAMLADK